MGFVKKPKINIPVAEPAQEELPVKVEDTRSGTASDYNARARQRKTLMSTILSKSSLPETADTGDSLVSKENGLRKTLG